MIEEAIVSLLKQHAGTTRVNPSTETVKVTEALPRIVYTLIDKERDYTDDGTTGLPLARMQLDIFADRFTAARQIAENIRVNLDGYRGTVADTAIVRIWFPSERWGRGDRADGEDATVARYRQDMLIRYRE